MIQKYSTIMISYIIILISLLIRTIVTTRKKSLGKGFKQKLPGFLL